MDKMTLIVFSKTGHVLGAVSRNGNPGGALEPVDLVGEGFYLRDPEKGELVNKIQPDLLKIEVVDKDDKALLMPRNFMLQEGLLEAVEDLISSDKIKLLSNTKVEVSFNTNFTEDLEFYVLIEKNVDSGAGDILSLNIDSSSNPPFVVEGTVNLLDGDYSVLLVVPGYRPRYFSLTVPFQAP